MGGAAQSGINLHNALLQAGVDSLFFAAEQHRKGGRGIISFKNGYFKRRVLAILDQLPLMFYRKRDRRYTFTNNWFPVNTLIKAIQDEKPDIVHLHWIGKGLLRVEHLRRIKVPIVWTMHDNYAFTGGCHLVNNCVNFLSHCGACPYLGSKNEQDLSRRNFNRKKRTFNKSHLTFIAPSRWMFGLAKESALLTKQNIRHLPNLIDRDLYFPVNKPASKQGFGISSGVKVVLFGAFNSTGDVNKGFSELISALNTVAGDLNIIVFVFGSEKPEVEPVSKFPVRYFGYLSDIVSKRFLYSAADVTVVPSKIENLSNVIMESMACATPVVAFNTGGNSDLIDHRINGFLAAKGDINNLAEGIKWIVSNEQPEVLQTDAEKKINSVFNKSIVMNAHLELYNSLRNGG
jgi:glycosyltransferase involved in cell wall biosynthesis